MAKSILRYPFLIFLLSIISNKCFPQTDTDFWFVAPENSKNGFSNFDIPIYLRITAFDQAALVRISQPANPSFVAKNVNIQAEGFVTIDLSNDLEIVENKPPNTILNYGLHIESNALISVYYEIASTYCLCNPEIFSLKGRNALGTRFHVPTQNYFSNSGNYSPSPYNAIDIVATENNTTVRINPAKNIVGHSAGVPFTVTLMKGQTYSAVATSFAAAEHLFGSEIVSDKAIAVTMSDDLLEFYNCADMIGDQIIPDQIIGNEYIAVKGNLLANGNQAFILAVEDNTQIFIDGNTTPVATINSGQVYSQILTNTSTYIVSGKPVHVLQTSGFGCELGAAELPPINYSGSTRIVFSRTTSQSLGTILFTMAGNEGRFTVNGDPGIITAADFTAVPGTDGLWLSASIVYSLSQIPVGSNVIIKNSNGRFHLGLMIGDSNGGCSYGYFSNFSILNLGPDKTICNGDSLVLDAGPDVSTYLWSTGATSRKITLSKPGKYWVRGSSSGLILSDTIVLGNYPTPNVNIGPDQPVSDGQSIELSTAINNFVKYEWNTGDTSSSVFVFKPGKYWLKVTDNNGCNGSDTINVGYPGAQIYIPNNFTPNGDGFNDTFGPVTSGIGSLEMNISDNTGRFIHRIDSLNGRWSGLMPSGKLAPQGIYFFVLNAMGLDKLKYNRHGSVMLLTDKSSKDNISLVPNPVNSTATLNLNNRFSGERTISIFSSSGVPVRIFNTSEDIITLELGFLDKGLYIIKASDGIQNTETKFIKY